MSTRSPEIPSQLKSRINYKVIALVVGIFIGMLLYDYKYQDYVNNNFTLTDVVIILAPIGGGVACIFVARRYWGSKVFGKTYLSLAIALFLYGAGNITYEYLSDISQPNSQPYPSIADGFWIVMYPFFYYHLIRNIRHFKKTGPRPLVWMLPLAGSIVIAYLLIALSQQPPLDAGFYLGLYYNILDAGLVSLSILGVLVFRDSILGKVWLLLMIGFLIYDFADYWYYYTTDYNLYSDSHPVNMVWVLGFMVMTYALYKHTRTL
jgi:hypothetical protein